MEIGSFGGRQDGEHSGVAFAEIFDIFLMSGNFFSGTDHLTEFNKSDACPGLLQHQTIQAADIPLEYRG